MTPVVVVGAGIAGISAAYFLSVRHRVRDVVIVDPRAPLTLTSDKSTECYRNWWPDPSMVGLMNRSVDILEEIGRAVDFGLNRRGYLYVTGHPETMAELRQQVSDIAALGAGADLLDSDALRSAYPFITPSAIGGIRLRRAGWFSAQQLGRWMLDAALENGACLVSRKVIGLEPGVVALDDGTTIEVGDVVIAAGPMSAEVAELAGVKLPLFSELHLKVMIKDHLGAIPRSAPMTIWADAQEIDWADEERVDLEKAGRVDLLGQMPRFCHFRPEGGVDSPYVAALWEYQHRVLEPVWPLPEDPLYPEVVLRGLSAMVPALERYRHGLPHAVVDGGYYTKTVENRPLIGPSGVDGIHLMCGFSGFGVMAAPGAADLVSSHVTGAELPDYSSPFLLARYDDPGYVDCMAKAGTGQL